MTGIRLAVVCLPQEGQSQQGPPQDPRATETRGAEPRPPAEREQGTATEQPGTLQEPGPQQPTQSCFDPQMLPMLLVLVGVFYFLILRPQQKQEKQRRQMQASLKKGDQVVTTSGMHGTVAAIDEHSITLRVDQDVKLRFDRAAVQRVLGGEEPDAKRKQP